MYWIYISKPSKAIQLNNYTSLQILMMIKQRFNSSEILWNMHWTNLYATWMVIWRNSSASKRFDNIEYWSIYWRKECLVGQLFRTTVTGLDKAWRYRVVLTTFWIVVLLRITPRVETVMCGLILLSYNED